MKLRGVSIGTQIYGNNNELNSSIVKIDEEIHKIFWLTMALCNTVLPVKNENSGLYFMVTLPLNSSNRRNRFSK